MPARPVHPAAVPAPPLAPAGIGHTLVGRDQELALLQRLLQEFPAATRAAVVLIRGNPGMGKTSLLQHTARLARGLGAGVLKASASRVGVDTPLRGVE